MINKEALYNVPTKWVKPLIYSKYLFTYSRENIAVQSTSFEQTKIPAKRSSNV